MECGNEKTAKRFDYLKIFAVVANFSMVIIATANLYIVFQQRHEEILQFRPYIAVENLLQIPYIAPDKEKRFKLEFTITNYGRTAADNLEISAFTMTSGEQEIIATTTDSRAQGYIAPSQKYFYIGDDLGQIDLNNIQIGNTNSLLYRIKYRDYLDNKYTFVIELKSDNGQLYPYREYEE